MSLVHPFPARVVRPEWAHRLVTGLAELPAAAGTRRVVVLLSDGGDTSSLNTLEPTAAALAAAGPESRLVLPRIASGGATCALARRANTKRAP